MDAQMRLVDDVTATTTKCYCLWVHFWYITKITNHYGFEVSEFKLQ